MIPLVNLSVLTIPRRLYVGERQKLIRIAFILQTAQHRNHDGWKRQGQSQIEQQQILRQTGEKLREYTAKWADLLIARWPGRNDVVVSDCGVDDAVVVSCGNPAMMGLSP